MSQSKILRMQLKDKVHKTYMKAVVEAAQMAAATAKRGNNMVSRILLKQNYDFGLISCMHWRLDGDGSLEQQK